MPTVRIPVKSDMLEWACMRARVTPGQLEGEHARLKLSEWLEGVSHPSLSQLEEFARRTRTSVGLLLLPEPLPEPLPIPDFRTMPEAGGRQPSADLLDTIYLCQQRQEWYRDYARLNRLDPSPVVGSANLRQEPETVAGQWRAQVGIREEERKAIPTWTDALRTLIERVEGAGVLVMVSGVVGSNNTRKLDPGEFRGFAMADSLAPVIFINGSDTKAAQIFTLAHELGHLCLGQSALTDATSRVLPDQDVERWCNRFAAEFLVPAEELKALATDDIGSLARRFKVSTLVVLRRLFDLGRLQPAEYWSQYDAELARLKSIEPAGSGGGNFYYTTMARAGRRLTRALTASALEGQGSFTEALRLLGFKKMATFHKLAHIAWEGQ